MLYAALYACACSRSQTYKQLPPLAASMAHSSTAEQRSQSRSKAWTSQWENWDQTEASKIESAETKDGWKDTGAYWANTTWSSWYSGQPYTWEWQWDYNAGPKDSKRADSAAATQAASTSTVVEYDAWDEQVWDEQVPGRTSRLPFWGPLGRLGVPWGCLGVLSWI